MIGAVVIQSDGSGTKLLIVLVRQCAQHFGCVNSSEITCSKAVTDPYGRVILHQCFDLFVWLF